MSKPLIIVFGAVLLAGCAASRTHAPATEAIAPPAPTPIAVAVETPQNYASDALDSTAWTQTAIEHDLIYQEVYREAERQLSAALADPSWDALPHDERGGSVSGLAPAVILDVDETVLDNSAYQARLIRSGKEYDDASWARWVEEEAATALPGALDYTRFAAAHGVAVFYISNRDKSLDQATLDNLRKQGFPVAGPQSFLGLGTLLPGCEQVGTEKTCRRRLVAQKYRVLAQVGDQINDFVSVPANTAEGRQAAMAPYFEWIGQRWFVLPNPNYGSWEPALFWSQSAEQRHERKVEALRVQ
jgi:acid phosphatase